MSGLFFSAEERRKMRDKRRIRLFLGTALAFVCASEAAFAAYTVLSALEQTAAPAFDGSAAGEEAEYALGETRQSEKEPSGEESPAVSGTVSHTQLWEENRLRFNAHCRERGEDRLIRPSELFWSGERFVLSADVSGESAPKEIKAVIEGTGYETVLHREDGVWRGSLFDETMLYKWGRSGREKVVFRFSADIGGIRCEDRQRVYIDDRQPYWLLHRKE